MQRYANSSFLLTEYSRILVVGLGQTGYSVVEYLASKGKKCSVVDCALAPPKLADTQKHYPQVDIYLGGFEKLNAEHYDAMVVSPGVPLSTPFLQQAKKLGVAVFSDIALFLAENTQTIIAITGSNGKSTVTSLVGAMLQGAGFQPLVAGNIGTPVLNALSRGQQYNIAVLELSSFQLEALKSVNADTATILNVSADHLDRYESEGDYLLAKMRILRGAKRVVLPKNNEQLSQITVASDILHFGLAEPDSMSDFGVKRVSNRRYLMKGEEKLMKVADIPLIGLHNIRNVLAAFALVDFLQLDRGELAQAVKDFVGLPHRMQLIASTPTVRWVNDSKATNLDAAITALKSIDIPIIWLAGGQSKGESFSRLQESVPSNVQHIVLFGDTQQEIAEHLPKEIPFSFANTLEQAVDAAHSLAQGSCTILLSPACASFDMFQDFTDRGNQFIRCVQGIVNGAVL